MSFPRPLAIALATSFACSVFASNAAFAQEAPAAATLTGHVDLYSKYVLRGITSTYGPSSPLGNAGADAPESDKAALQGGVDWTHPSGFYAGYWASTINYSYKQLGNSYTQRSNITDFQKDKSIENDIYGGYTGKVGDIGYTVGLTGYVYYNGSNANAFETKLGATYDAFSLNAQTLLKDVVWGNKGDTYFTLNYTKALPYDISMTGSLGYYLYKKEGKFNGTKDTLAGTACAAGESFAVNGCYAGGAPTSSAFRHLIISLSKPIPGTAATVGVQGILGGDNRFGIKQKNQFVANVTYGF
jgi:uncharacterized protein (TIGR02001 family)